VTAGQVTEKELVLFVSPKISVTEVGGDNEYGHSHTEVLE